MKATFNTLLSLANNEASARRKLLQTLSRKTEAEQRLIFDLAGKLQKIHYEPEQKQEAMNFFKSLSRGDGLYYQLLLAIQLHEANRTKSEYISINREARQDVQSLKTAQLDKVIEMLMPVVEELKEAGATFETIAKTLTKKHRKMLSGRTVRTDYLKKVYYRYKKNTA